MSQKSNQRVLRPNGIRIIEFSLSKNTKLSRAGPRGVVSGGGGGEGEGALKAKGLNRGERGVGGYERGLNHTLVGGVLRTFPVFFLLNRCL